MRKRDSKHTSHCQAPAPLQAVTGFQAGCGSAGGIDGRELGERSLWVRGGSETWLDPWSAAPTCLPSHCAHNAFSGGWKRGRGAAEAVQSVFPPHCLSASTLLLSMPSPRSPITNV